MSRILIYYAGGTIGMQPSEKGYVATKGFEAQLRRDIPVLFDSPGVEVNIEEAEHPIDSAEARIADWYELAATLKARSEDFDGFVVLHGTDTMAHAASYLSFLLRGLDKPVVLTGAQVPLYQPYSDARNNILGAVEVACQAPVREVTLFFGGKLLRGNRTAKVRATGFEAFESPNYPHLGERGLALQIHWDRLWQQDSPAAEVPACKDIHLAVVPIYPGLTGEQLRGALSPLPDGFVLLTYGVGNGPTSTDGIVAALKEAIQDNDSVGVALSWCPHGTIQLGAYAAGGGFAEAGLVSGGDMTLEAALAKMHVLLSRGLSPQEVRDAFAEALAGEISLP